MKIFIYVVLLLHMSFAAYAESLSMAVDNIEKEWALIYYKGLDNPSPKYAQLLAKVDSLVKNHPEKAEPLFWEAIILASDADHQSPINAIDQINQARDLLNKVISISPTGLNGSAHVALGSLYYLTPPWPIAFGDNDKAHELLTKALKISPESIEANYFYGDFLLAQNEPERAASYFHKAINTPSRKNQLFADDSLKHQAKLALENATDRKISNAKANFLSFFNSETAH